MRERLFLSAGEILKCEHAICCRNVIHAKTSSHEKCIIISGTGSMQMILNAYILKEHEKGSGSKYFCNFLYREMDILKAQYAAGFWIYDQWQLYRLLIRFNSKFSGKEVWDILISRFFLLICIFCFRAGWVDSYGLFT